MISAIHDNAIQRVEAGIMGNSASNANKRQAQACSVYLLFWVAFVLPTIGMAYTVERVFVVAASIFCLAELIITRRLPKRYLGTRVSALLMAFFLISFLYLSTYFYYLAIRQYDTGWRDLFEIARYPLIAVFSLYTISIQSSVRPEELVQRAVKPSIWFGFVCLVTCHWRVPIISEGIRHLYSDVKTWAKPGGGLIRFSIPFENPNFLGLYLVWALTALLFVERRTSYLTVLLTMILIFATGSRTAWVATVVVMVCWVIACSVTQGKRYQAMIVLLVACISLIVAMYRGTLERIAQAPRVVLIIDAMERGSILLEPNVAFRVNQWATLVPTVMTTSPLFGFGPSKYAYVSMIDSQYLTWIIRNGIVGLLLIVYVLGRLAFIRPAIQFMKQKRWYSMMGVVAFSGSTLATLFTGAFLDNFRLAVLFLVYAVLIIGNPDTSADSG